MGAFHPQRINVPQNLQDGNHAFLRTAETGSCFVTKSLVSFLIISFNPLRYHIVNITNKMSINPELRRKIDQSKVLLVGAGGIGCEVLKNLTLTGFKSIDAVDLDTIDVSNLNRQFLFNKSNVGQSKSKVAIDISRKEYALTDEGLNFNSIHKSITLSEFDVDFFRQYTFVINALDNRAARSHVNRMCLSAEVPLLESGTAGYTGQLKLIKNSLTACYECEGIQKDGRTYATCTIRNTPSLPIHCIVWAKNLFHQLFGEDDPDNDVSPQMEADDADTNNTHKNEVHANGTNGIQMEHENTNPESIPPQEANDKHPKRSLSTRLWAKENNYDAVLLIQKLYNDDIKYLLMMDNLWKERAKPMPLVYSDLIKDSHEEPQCSKTLSNDNLKLGNQRLWSMKECVDILSDSVAKLHQRLETSGYQHWDKDDEVALNFVVAASNLRSKCFNIERKSPFDVKSLAGNIVPAISSTNSIVGGLLVLQALRLLKSIPVGEEYRKLDDSERNNLMKDSGRLSFLNYTTLAQQSSLIASFDCLPPVDTCLACAKGNTPEIEIHISMQDTTLADLVDKIVIGTFHFVCPDLGLNDDSGIIIWSKDESDEKEDETKKKKLIDLPHIKQPKTRLLVSDLIQDKEIVLVLIDEKVDEEEHKNFFYARMNGNEITV